MKDSSETAYPEISEDLLSSWISISISVRNERLVQAMTYQEMLVCGILLQAERNEEQATASDIVSAAGILKSQVNRILNAMEKKRLLIRVPSQQDHRRRFLRLTPSGRSQYQRQHAEVLKIMDRLVSGIGPAPARKLAFLLNQASSQMKEIEETI